MIIKCPPAPPDGGSARGNVRYILGYSLTDKRELWDEKNAAYHALMAEAADRPDHGVGVIFKPEIGGGIRPSSVYATGLASLATADLEMQSSAFANGRVRSATRHEIFSFGESDAGITDEQMLEAVRRIYLRVGLAGAQYVAAVHRDSDYPHVHVARSGIDPRSLRAFDTQMLHTRLDRAARFVEMEMGLSHDRGLAVVDADVNGVPVVRDSTKSERMAWAREDGGYSRKAARERSRYVDNAAREGHSFERWGEARVEPRIRELIRGAKDAGEPLQPIDILNKAVEHGCQIEIKGRTSEQAYAVLRDVSVSHLWAQQQQQFAEAQGRLKEQHANGLLRDETLAELRAAHRRELVAEMLRLEREGSVVPLTPRMQGELRAAFGNLDALADTQRAQDVFRAKVETDPAYIVRALTQTSSTFSRDDVDRFLVDRLDDVGDIEQLSHKIFTEVNSLVLLSPDVGDGVWTTTAMRETESRLADDARTIASRKDSRYDPAIRNRVIAEMEAERSVGAAEPFRFSPEQRAALAHDGQLSVILGGPGCGKSLLMEVHRREAEALDRKIQGITVAQAAALRLEVLAGFPTVNSAYALVGDDPKRELVPRDGTLVLDEAAMFDSRTMHAILALASERNTNVVAVGDHRQINAVGAGGPFHILDGAAREAGTFSELTENRRQKRKWHADAVRFISAGIEATDERLFHKAADVLHRNDALRFVESKDAAIQDIVTWYKTEREISKDVLLVATDRPTVRYLNEELLRQNTDRPAGRNYSTDTGETNLSVGDRFIFGANSTKDGFANGDLGTVVETGEIIIGVRLDRTEGIVKFDSRKMTEWSHGYATTVARSQGASVRALGGIVDSAATAETFNVLASRSEASFLALIPKTAFENTRELAEHLAGHIVAKGTTQDIGPILASQGGPESFYAQNIAAQRMSAANPARQRYEAEWGKLRAARDRELLDTAAEFRARRQGATDAGELKTLRQEQRRAEAGIAKAFQPEDFTVWLYRHQQREEAVVDQLAVLRSQRKSVSLPGLSVSPAIERTQAPRKGMRH